MSNKKTIVLFVVEGPTDSNTIAPCLAKMVSENTAKKLEVKIVHGDILTEYIDGTRKFKVTRQNVKVELARKIEYFMKNAYPQLKSKDIDSIYYFTDTDACFTGDKDYHKNKKECLEEMFGKIDYLKINNLSVFFRTLFIHVNLEHALHNKEEKLSPSEKEILSKEYGRVYYNNPDKLIETLNSIIHWNTYSESYAGVVQLTPSDRASNLNVFINSIKEYIPD